MLRDLFSKPYRTVSAAQAADLAEDGAVLLDGPGPPLSAIPHGVY